MLELYNYTYSNFRFRALHLHWHGKDATTEVGFDLIVAWR